MPGLAGAGPVVHRVGWWQRLPAEYPVRDLLGHHYHGRVQVAGDDRLDAEARRLGVDARLDAYADADDIRALEPDVVIMATGGLPETPALSAGTALVVSTWDVLSGEVRPGRRVLVFDDHGSDQALSAAERLAADGSEVEIVTPDRLVGQAGLRSLSESTSSRSGSGRRAAQRFHSSG